MDKYRSELFGEFHYAEKMTYEELLECEDMLFQELEIILHDGGAQHLDFTPHGDILMLQCAFEFQNPEILRDIAQQIAELLPSGIKARLMSLQKNLATYTLYWISKGEWREKTYEVPIKAPDDAKKPKF